MKRMKRDAILTLLIEKLRDRGSWCGETHVQKATYFLQDMLQLDAGFDFVLYKHGPFSFDLRDELTAMRADDYLDLEHKGGNFGPSLATGRNSALLKRQFPKTLARQEPKVDFVASKFGDKNVSELERLATALYVTRLSESKQSVEDRAEVMISLKPHISREDAIRAVETVEDWLAEADTQFQSEEADG